MFKASLNQLVGYLQTPRTVGCAVRTTANPSLIFESAMPSVLVEGVSTDSRTLKPGNVFIALTGEHFNGHVFIPEAIQKGASVVIASEVIKATVPVICVENTLLALAQIAKGWRTQFNIPVIGITGSAGKTTVKEMIASVLGQSKKGLVTPGSLNNEIGVPLTLCQLSSQHQFAVIEMGARKKGDLAYLNQFVRPNITLVTNASSAHLTGFGTVEGVAAAKGELYHATASDGVSIINADSEFFEYWKLLCHHFSPHRKTLSFGLHKKADIRATLCQKNKNGCYQFKLMSDKGTEKIKVSLPGQHTILNALAAAAVGIACGVSTPEIAAGLSCVKPIPGRLVLLTSSEGATIIDDTYNANIESVRAAIQFLSDQSDTKILVLGDLAELGDEAQKLHAWIGQEAKAKGISQLFTVGELSAFAGKNFGSDLHFQSIEPLVVALKKILKPGVTVLIKGSRVAGLERVVKALVTIRHDPKLQQNALI